MSKTKATIIVSISFSDGYGYIFNGLKKDLTQALSDQYQVEIKEEPLKTDGESYLYLMKGDEKVMIFSNKFQDAKQFGCVFGSEFDESSIGEITEKVKELLN